MNNAVMQSPQKNIVSERNIFMKKFSFLIFTLFLISLVWAKADYINNPNHLKLSVAATDDILAGKVNPAALAFGNADGMAYLRGFNTGRFSKDYSLVFSMNKGGFVYDRYDRVNYYSYYISGILIDDLYLSANWNWKDHTFNTGRLGLSVLYRPLNSLSIGTVYNKRHVTSFEGNGSEIEKDIFTAGIAFRPFFNSEWQNRITFSADANIYSGEVKSPTLGITTELIRGFSIGGYADLEEETMGLRFTLVGSGSDIGGVTQYNNNDDLDSDTGYQGGLAYIQANRRTLGKFRPKFGSDKYYVLTLDSEIVEKFDAAYWGPVFSTKKSQMRIADLKYLLNSIAKDKSYDGLIVKPIDFKANLAAYSEIIDALLKIKESGKKIIFYFDSISNFNYVLAASVADEIYMNPKGYGDIRGFSGKIPHISEILDKYNMKLVDSDSTHQDIAQESNKSLNSFFEAINSEYKRLITNGRGNRLTDSIDRIMAKGPYINANDMIAAGLIDKLIYWIDIKAELESKNGNSIKFSNDVQAATYIYDWKTPTFARAALFCVDGYIHSGDSDEIPSVQSEVFAKAISRARNNDAIDAIILRVNSRGGTAVASEAIANEIRKCTVGRDKKPVYVSIGGYAASGGYLISCYADKIYANPNSLIGSLNAIGVVPEDDNGDLGQQISTADTSFREKVLEGRKLSQEAVSNLTTGELWNGVQAQELGLVDEIGSLEEVKSDLKKMFDVEVLYIHEYAVPETKLEMNFSDRFFNKITGRLTDEKPDQMYKPEQFIKENKENVLFLLPLLFDQSYR